VVEVARHGNSSRCTPTSSRSRRPGFANVTVTDLSTADYATDSALFDSREWRHRLRRQVSSTQVKVNLDGMIGADACCAVDDERATAHAGYRVAFDVVPEQGETWKLDMSQLIKGAHTANSEGVGGGYRAQSNISAVTGRYQVDGGAWQTFSFDVGERQPRRDHAVAGRLVRLRLQRAVHRHQRRQHPGHGRPGGGRGVRLRPDRLVGLEPGVPAEAGNESAIRLGANDSLTNNFSVGDYPGQGNRNIVDDGHFATITLSTVGG
jgi:hypothetical protein